MVNIDTPYIYRIGGFNLNVLLNTEKLVIDKRSGSYPFLINNSEFVNTDLSISFTFKNNIETFTHLPSFTVRSFGEHQTPYEWNVYEEGKEFVVIVNVDDNPFTNKIKVVFNLADKFVKVEMQLIEDPGSVVFDPFFQPVGSILLTYLVHHEGGIMLHSSGVKDGNSGYVFTAVSGTGKSTMAGLWQSVGGKIINDDRLILMPGEDGVVMTNTPMPYYQDVYKESPVTAILLIKQSPENYLKPLSGAAGVAGLMANCIQFLYDKEMVKKHMVSLTAIAERCPIYEVGFKPDTEIVEIIRSEFGRE